MLDDLAVDPGPGEALAGEVVEQRVVLALAAPHDRRQHLEAGALGQLRGRGRRSAAGVWRVSRVPSFGQCGTPMRAYSRRR